ncbi:MAG: hypothetical protein DRN33_01545 [Thermoplasmata archaeon]|nr:MAG: hypothetical protein DRN33_01545 [Thermoplasmata archaeon]
MGRIQAIMLLLNSIILILAALSFYYFSRLMKLVKVRRGAILATSGVFLLTGYVFFIMPWIAIGGAIPMMENFSYILVSIAFIILLYGVSRIYMDWKGAIK